MADDVAAALREFADSIRTLDRTVNKLAVLMERQLASGDAVQRRAEKVLNGLTPEKIKAMNDQLKKKLGSR